MISNVETKVMSAYASALHKKLEGTDRLEPRLASSAEYRRTMTDTVSLVEVIQSTRHDMLRLGFEWNEGKFQMIELELFIWQDRGALTGPELQFISASQIRSCVAYFGRDFAKDIRLGGKWCCSRG